ncbi:uncharacterized protein PG998_014306 [Apiospora kogelbergensis]|uniref:uncharacterized protein n=1 Tax=Apiospora kogelbergensis TaxID=1337665 RepID=UPI003130EA38
MDPLYNTNQRLYRELPPGEFQATDLGFHSEAPSTSRATIPASRSFSGREDLSYPPSLNDQSSGLFECPSSENGDESMHQDATAAEKVSVRLHGAVRAGLTPRVDPMLKNRNYET